MVFARLGGGRAPTGIITSRVFQRFSVRRPNSLFSLALVAVVSFLGGAGLVASVGVAGASTYRSLDIFAKVLAYVENSYVDEVDSRTLIHGAIRGMLATLDSYTVFLPAEEYRRMKADTAGEFGGLGIEVRKEGDRLVVVEPLEDSPASRAGILPGDWIVSIDDTPTANLSVTEAVKMMRGQPGTKVRLGLFREGFSQPLEFVLLRDRIQIRSVEARLYPGGIGYVRIKSFQEKTESFLTKALGELRQQNGKELSGLVLDLRGNPGGLLDQAVRVADRFLAQGEIVTTRGRGGKILDIETAHRAGTEPDYPIVILVDDRSASASEVLAGALQDHGRAVVMGTTTFGKGSVQTVVDLDDGSGLKITVARYYTPKHRSIHGTGIEPDVVVPRDGQGIAPPLPVLVAADGEAAETDDIQLRVALRTLRSWDAFLAQLSAQVQTAQAE